MDAPKEGFYSTEGQSISAIFDLRDLKAAKSLHLQRATLRELGELEFIGPDHAVLIARPGGAWRLEA
jgi:hypothetical protein